MKRFFTVAPVLAILAFTGIAHADAAQQFPVRPVRFIVPYPPGGGIATPDAQDALAKQGMEPFISTSPEQVGTYIGAEIARYGKIMKAANIKLEN